MMPRILVLAAVALAVVMTPARADAKSTTWVIAGGDLAPYAAAGMTIDAWPADDPAQPGLYSPDFGWGGAGVGHGFLRVLAPDRVGLPLA